MGWFSKKTESPYIGDLEDMGDEQIKRLMALGRVKGKSPREIRKTAKAIRLKTEGERGIGAIRAAAKRGGTGNRKYETLPLRERVHPAEYQRILEREAKKQGLI